MEEVNRVEIAALRERSHEYGNAIQELKGWVEQSRERDSNINEKLDAIHASIKEDIGEIRGAQEKGFQAMIARQDKTNGRVTELEKETARQRGGLAVLALGLPTVTALLVWGLSTLVH